MSSKPLTNKWSQLVWSLLTFCIKMGISIYFYKFRKLFSIDTFSLTLIIHRPDIVLIIWGEFNSPVLKLPEVWQPIHWVPYKTASDVHISTLLHLVPQGTLELLLYLCNLLGSVAEYTKHSNKRIVKHNPLNNLTLDPKSDQHLISLYSIIPESPIKVTRIKEIIKTTKEALMVKQILLVNWLGRV